MSSDARAIPAAALLLALTAGAMHSQEPATARLSGIPRDVACAPASPLVRPKPTIKVVAGRDSRKTLFGNGDAVVISGGTAQGLKNGDEFYVRRIVGDQFTEAVKGGAVPISIHTAGMVQIVEAQTDVSIGLITYGCDGIVEGDYLERFAPEPLPAGAVGNTPDYTRPGHIIMGDDRRQMGGPGEFVIIDRGSDHGVRQGQRVTIFRRTLADGSGPVMTVGTAMVYVVKPQSSVVRLERSVDAVYVGDFIALHR